jgi:hypothetical protein
MWAYKMDAIVRYFKLALLCCGRFMSARLVRGVDWQRAGGDAGDHVAFIFAVKQYKKSLGRNVLPSISSYSTQGIAKCCFTLQGSFETSNSLPMYKV